MQTDQNVASDTEMLALKLERELMHAYGSPLLTGQKLAEAMGFRSIHSLRKQMSQKTFPLSCLPLTGGEDALLWSETSRCGWQSNDWSINTNRRTGLLMNDKRVLVV